MYYYHMKMEHTLRFLFFMNYNVNTTYNGKVYSGPKKFVSRKKSRIFFLKACMKFGGTFFSIIFNSNFISK